MTYCKNFDPVLCLYVETVFTQKNEPGRLGYLMVEIGNSIGSFVSPLYQKYSKTELINADENENYSQTVLYSSKGEDSLYFKKTTTLKEGVKTDEEDPLIESEIVVEFEDNAIKTYSELYKYKSGLCSSKKLTASFDEPDNATLPDDWRDLAKRDTFRAATGLL